MSERTPIWTWRGEDGARVDLVQGSIGGFDLAYELGQFEGGPITLAFMDPPYNQGVKYADDPTRDRCNQWQVLIDIAMGEMEAALAAGGTAWALVSEAIVDQMPYAPAFWTPMPRVIWQERFAQYRNTELTVEHRHLLRWSRGKPIRWNPDAIRVRSMRQIRGDKRADPRGRVPGTVWTVRRLQGTSLDRVKWHPAQLPPEPLERMVKGWTDPGDTVLELFAGSGSLARVCVRLGRRYLGVEQSPTYCQLVMERLLAEYAGEVTEPVEEAAP